MAATGRVFLITRFAVHDGPGIRVAVFLKGCPLRCWWCHSPESQRTGPELVFKADRCIACGTCSTACTRGAIEDRGGIFVTKRARCTACGDCSDACPTAARSIAGRDVSVSELLAVIEQDRVFLDRSAGGVTFSGGEPTMQPAFLGAALDACHAAGLHTAVETSGCTAWRAMSAALGADLVFFDLKSADDNVHRRVTGASNRRILENFTRIAREHPAVRPRLPLVPGINDAPENLDALGDLIAAAGIRDVDLLPYHTAGKAKYERIGRPYLLDAVAPPTQEAIGAARARLERYGLRVHIGGSS
jgi:pyruvate formate lyase activating enzyme